MWSQFWFVLLSQTLSFLLLLSASGSSRCFCVLIQIWGQWAERTETPPAVDYHWKIMNQGLSFNFSLCGFDALHLPERFSTFALIVIFCDCVHSFLLHRSTWTNNILSFKTCRQVDSSDSFSMKLKNIGCSQPLRVRVQWCSADISLKTKKII